MSAEKRKHPRFEISQLVEIDYGHETFFSAEGLNLSRTGVLCKTEEECPLSSKIFMMMTFPDKHEQKVINFEGIVVRSVQKQKGWEIGISIKCVNPLDEPFFDGVISKLS